MKNLTYILSVIVLLGLVVAPARAGTDNDADFTKKIDAIFAKCQTIKPGMTRVELLKVFTTEEGGISTAKHRTFIYRGWLHVKVDVDFTLSDPKQDTHEERPADIIIKISKPHLEGFQT